MDGISKLKIDEFLKKENWILLENSDNGNSIYEYRNEFCSLKIQHVEDKGAVLYLFEEEIIQSLVKIEYKGNILRLLELISAYNKKMSSTYYAEQMKRIISEFPDVYYFVNNEFVVLRAGNDNPISFI